MAKSGMSRPPVPLIPHCAEFIVGHAFGVTRWLHAGYKMVYDRNEETP
jgi:hypothetical protein